MDYIPGTRALQRIWIPERGLWVFVWCHDDGDVDVNHRLAFAIVSSPSEFNPEFGQFVLVNNSSSDWSYVYGVPYAIESHKGIVKVHYTDLNIALGWPRKTTGETEEFDIQGKDPRQGYSIEGHFLSGNSTNGPIVWSIKNSFWHNNPGPVLEVTDITSKNFVKGGGSNSAPTGTMLVEYQRDPAGRVKIDGDGFPLVALVDPTVAGYQAQNFKIGYLGLSFQKDYYGRGIHGWIGSGGDSYVSFKITEKSDTSIKFGPGLVNNILPDNIFVEIPYSNTGTQYVKIQSSTDGKIVTSCEIVIDGSPVVNDSSTVQKGAAPGTFTVPIYVIVDGVMFRTWGNGNVAATPTEAIRADRTAIVPGTSPYDIYYYWSLSELTS